MFMMNMEQRRNVRMVSVSFEDTDTFETNRTVTLEEVLLASERAGFQIRTIMSCHPHNPLR